MNPNLKLLQDDKKRVMNTLTTLIECREMLARLIDDNAIMLENIRSQITNELLQSKHLRGLMNATTEDESEIIESVTH